MEIFTKNLRALRSVCLCLIVYAALLLGPQAEARLDALDKCADAIELSSYLRRDPHAFLANRKLRFEDIDTSFRHIRLNPQNRMDRGTMNSGVFRGSTWIDSDTFAIKLSRLQAFQLPRPVRRDFDGLDSGHPRFRDYLILHEVLGKLGYAPALRGYLPRDEANRYADFLEDSGASIDGDDFVGIVMKEIPGAWNIHRLADEVPFYVRSWGIDEVANLLRRIKQIEVGLRDLGICPTDIQFFVTDSPQSQLFLGDLDAARFLEPGESPAFLTEDAEQILYIWEKETHRAFPEPLFQSIMGKPSVAFSSAKPLIEQS